jgi:two-component system, NarL family, response regulator NreC
MFAANAYEGSRQEPERSPMTPLTSRELDVVKLVADGKTYKEIAQILGLSFKTVDSYSQRIKLKTQCHSVALLVRFAIRNGLVEL